MFWDHSRFTESCQKMYREDLCTLHSVPPEVTSCVTILQSKTNKLTLVQSTEFIQIGRYFLPVYHLYFHSLQENFSRAKVFNFDKVQFINFSFLWPSVVFLQSWPTQYLLWNHLKCISQSLFAQAPPQRFWIRRE